MTQRAASQRMAKMVKMDIWIHLKFRFLEFQDLVPG